MDILINNEKINYTLEREKGLGEVIASLESLAHKHNSVIESIQVDNAEVPVDYESVDFKRRVDAIRELRVVVSSSLEAALNTALATGELIKDALGELSAKPEELLCDGVLEKVSLIYSGLNQVLSVFSIKSGAVVRKDGAGLDESLARCGRLLSEYDRRYLDEKGECAIKKVLDELFAFIPEILMMAAVKNDPLFEVLSDKQRVLFTRATVRSLLLRSGKSIRTFEHIGENIQVGNDKEALDEICGLAELLEEIISLFGAAKRRGGAAAEVFEPSAIRIEGLLKDITKHLSAAEDAFRRVDLVTVGDLFEYELKPLFEKFIPLLVELENRMEKAG